MYVEFDLTNPGDVGTSSFAMLRVAMFRLKWDRWCESHGIDNFQWITEDNRVRIKFGHEATMTMFALKWQDRNYRIVS